MKASDENTQRKQEHKPNKHNQIKTNEQEEDYVLN